MSRSNQTDIQRIAERYMEWGGDKGAGKLNWYDKEKKEKIWMNLPFTFLVLDTLSTITGFDERNQSGFWSNEVRDIKHDILIVKNKNGKVFQGTYDQSKAFGLPNMGAEYAQSVYVAFKNDTGELVIGHIKFRGAALSAWIDFRKATKNILEVAVMITGSEEGKKGAVTFQKPVFKAIEVSPETNAKAIELDKELQEYLTAYFGRAKEEVKDEAATDVAKEEIKTGVNAPNTSFLDEMNAPLPHEMEDHNNDGYVPPNQDEAPF